MNVRNQFFHQPFLENGYLEPKPPSGQRPKKTRAAKKSAKHVTENGEKKSANHATESAAKKSTNYVTETMIKIDELLEIKKKKKLVTLETSFVNDHQPPVVTLKKNKRKRVENAREFRTRCNENRRALSRRNKLPREIMTNAFEENLAVTTSKLPPARPCEDLNLPNIRASSAVGRGGDRLAPQPPKLPNISAHRRRRNIK